MHKKKMRLVTLYSFSLPRLHKSLQKRDEYILLIEFMLQLRYLMLQLFFLMLQFRYLKVT